MPDGNAVRHAATIPLLDVPAFMAELEAQGFSDVRTIKPGERPESWWATNPARRVNGGKASDRELGTQFSDMAARMGLPPGADYTAAIVCAACAAEVPGHHH
jgi:hypothetical protein